MYLNNKLYQQFFRAFCELWKTIKRKDGINKNLYDEVVNDLENKTKERKNKQQITSFFGKKKDDPAVVDELRDDPIAVEAGEPEVDHDNVEESEDEDEVVNKDVTKPAQEKLQKEIDQMGRTIAKLKYALHTEEVSAASLTKRI